MVYGAAAMIWLLPLAVAVCAPPAELHHFEIESTRAHRVGELPMRISIKAVDKKGDVVTGFCGPAKVSGLVQRRKGKWWPIEDTGPLAGGKVVFDHVRTSAEYVVVEAGHARGEWSPRTVRQLPGWVSIAPPLFAIVLAILLRQALIALFAGVWLGAMFLYGYNPLTSLLRTFDTHLVAALIPVDPTDGSVDTGHAAIILFTMALGGMVGVISRSGGTLALVNAIARRARSRRSGMLTAWFSGLVVFFDDYANCLLVGNTVRPFSDRMRISREKLAYIVDSTAAPVATIAVISTWIGYQVGQLDQIFGKGTGYDLFLDILPYSFYSFFTLGFVFLISVTVRDFGPMLKAERRAATHGLLLREGAKPLMDRELTDISDTANARAGVLTALVPIVSVIGIVGIGLYVSGKQSLGVDGADASFRSIIAAADSYAVLLWAAFGGSLVALFMVITNRSLGASEAVDAWVAGVKAMVMAVLILVLAWALGDMCKEHLQTGEWLLGQVSPSPHFLPFLTFFIAGAIAFATGSSFSTMAIVIPIAGPMAWALTGDGSGLGSDVAWSIRHATLAAVLSGAVFGDHCSPISDTTIMSSMSSAADHMDHVRTQTPYAFTCAGVAAFIGFLPAGWGVSPFITLPVGAAILVAIVAFVGKKVEPDG